MDDEKLLKGKRLLILGGSQWKEAIKQFSDEYGITLIATGNDTNAGIFEIAHESYNINSTDVESMKQLIIEKHIDGVYMGGSEPVITAACEYINDLGLPCYCTKEQWNYLQNKVNFKDLCVKNGLPVVPRYEVTLNNIEDISEDAFFPVITKPTDGCGSSGFSVCNNLDELKRGYKIAAESSPTGGVIVEKFVKNDGVVVFYTFSEGNVYFSGLEDKYPVKYEKQGSYVGGLFVFESQLASEFRARFEDKIQMMINSIGIKEGSAWIEVFHDGDEYYFNEVGFRYGGSVSVYPVNYFYEINQVASDIYYALTGKSKIFGHRSLMPITLHQKKKYCVYPVHIKSGIIKSIKGEDVVKAMENVTFITLTKHEGDFIADTGSFSQAFALVHFVCDDEKECIKTIDEICMKLSVIDSEGNDMIHKMLDFNKVKF